MAINKKNEDLRLNSTRHKDTRKNIPTCELRDFAAEGEASPATILYPRGPSLDPQLVWKANDEQDQEDLAVPVVPVYIQEQVYLHRHFGWPNNGAINSTGKPSLAVKRYAFADLKDYEQSYLEQFASIKVGDLILIPVNFLGADA